MGTPSLEAWIAISLTCVVQFGITITLVAIFLFSRRGASSAKTWPSTTGTVITSKAEGQVDSDGGVVSYPLVVYQYTIGETTFESRKIKAGSNWGGAGVDKVLARYPVGAQVTVYYDPDNPSDSVLERTAASMTWVWITLILVNICFFGILAVIALAT